MLVTTGRCAAGAARRKAEAVELLPTLRSAVKAAKTALGDAHKQHGMVAAKLERAQTVAKSGGGGGASSKQQKQVQQLTLALKESHAGRDNPGTTFTTRVHHNTTPTHPPVKVKVKSRRLPHSDTDIDTGVTGRAPGTTC